MNWRRWYRSWIGVKPADPAPALEFSEVTWNHGYQTGFAQGQLVGREQLLHEIGARLEARARDPSEYDAEDFLADTSRLRH